MKVTSWLALCLAAALGAAAADSWKLPAETAKFKSGQGAPLAIVNCSACHSADYISTQPPLPRSTWKATVEKMRLRYGAPINTNSTDEIVEYLAREYGKK
jgi:sulfite dehydrogenase (cytochrome) subunit B